MHFSLQAHSHLVLKCVSYPHYVPTLFMLIPLTPVVQIHLISPVLTSPVYLGFFFLSFDSKNQQSTVLDIKLQSDLVAGVCCCPFKVVYVS